MLFDANCQIGRRNERPFYEPWKTQDLIQTMARCGIDRALVRLASAIEYDPAAGMDLLAREIRPYPALQGMAVIGPPSTMYLPPVDQLLQNLLSGGIRAVALYPKTHGYPLEFGCQDLFGALAKYKVPVFLSMREADWNAVYLLLATFKGLNLILADVSTWDRARYTYPLMSEFPGLRMETSLLRTHLCLEDICTRFGSHRLLWGSGWPRWTPGASLGMLNYAMISDTDRANIASGNLQQLLDEVRTK
jgi:hypothetical protein